MDQFTFWLVVLTFMFMSAVLAGAFAYFVVRLLKTMDNRLLLALKVMSHNLKSLKIYGDKLNGLKSDSKKFMSCQSKAFDYQNVLINSLNRQLRNLDAILSDSQQLAHSKKNLISSEKATPVINLTPADTLRKNVAEEKHPEISSKWEEKTNPAGLAKNTVTVLDRLLVEKRTKSEKDQITDHKIAKLSSMFGQDNIGDADHLESAARRASNG